MEGPAKRSSNPIEDMRYGMNLVVSHFDRVKNMVCTSRDFQCMQINLSLYMEIKINWPQSLKEYKNTYRCLQRVKTVRKVSLK